MLVPTYGEMLKPMARDDTKEYQKTCISNMKALLRGSPDATIPESIDAMCNLFVPCAGAVYKPGKRTIQLAQGEAFLVKWQLVTPHAGELQVNLVKNPTNSSLRCYWSGS